MIEEVLVILAAAIVGVVCAILIFHRAYKDKLPRRLGLAIISLCAFVQVVHALDDYIIRPLAVVLWIGLALFFYSHACSFIHRLRNKDKTWYESDDTIMVMKGRKR